MARGIDWSRHQLAVGRIMQRIEDVMRNVADCIGYVKEWIAASRAKKAKTSSVQDLSWTSQCGLRPSINEAYFLSKPSRLRSP